MENIKGRVAILRMGMVNAFLIKGDKPVLVDTGLPGNLDKLKAALKAEGVEVKDIALIIVTHNHTDHVGELYNLKELSKAKVLIHKDEAEALKNARTTPVKPITLFGKIMTKFFKNSEFKAVNPDITFYKELSLEQLGVKGKVLHTPGHTPGSLSVILDSGEIIVGDMVSFRKIGSGFKASKPIFADDIKTLKESIRKIISLKPSKVYASHGGEGNAEAMKKLLERI